MINPAILQTLIVNKTPDGEFGVFTNAQIHKHTTVEICAWLPITKKVQILLKSNGSSLANAIFENPDGMDRERAFIEKLADMELQKRLDAGLISQSQFTDLILSSFDPTKLLHVESHALLLGFGSIYRRSQVSPNLNWEYDSSSKLYKFFAVQDIQAGQELTYFTN
jgi:hypothetical protein